MYFNPITAHGNKQLDITKDYNRHNTHVQSQYVNDNNTLYGSKTTTNKL